MMNTEWKGVAIRAYQITDLRETESGQMSDRRDKSYEEILNLSDDEYIKKYLAEIDDLNRLRYFKKVDFSYIGKNVLGRPRNQGKCSSCVGCVLCDLIGALLALKEPVAAKRVLTYYSPQHLVDCPRNPRTKVDECGCKESSFPELSRFVKNHGLLEEVDYRYVGKKQACMDSDCPESECGTKPKRLPKNQKRMYIQDCEEVPITCFEDAKSLIRISPVGAVVPLTSAFENLGPNFEGIYEHANVQATCSSSKKNKGSQKNKKERGNQKATLINKEGPPHAVLIIGYGIENGKEFFLIKNSWGCLWGYLGYAKIAASLIKQVFCPKL